MDENKRKLTGNRIGIFGKGGAGKSTVTVFLARALRDSGYDVCVLDADSTNIGLPQALGVNPPPKTLLDHFGGMIFSGGLVTCPVDDPTPLADAEISLDMLSPKFYVRNAEGITLLTAGKIGAQGPGAGCDGPITKIARDLIIDGEDQEPITLIDFKAGFEDSARGAVTSLDWAIVVVDSTMASVEIAANMRNMVQQIKAGVLPATAHLESPELAALANKIFTEAKIKDVFFILNRIPNTEIENYLRDRLAQRGIEPLGAIHEYPSIPVAWLKGTPVRAEKATVEAQLITERLEELVNGHS